MAPPGFAVVNYSELIHLIEVEEGVGMVGLHMNVPDQLEPSFLEIVAVVESGLSVEVQLLLELEPVLELVFVEVYGQSVGVAALVVAELVVGGLELDAVVPGS